MCIFTNDALVSKTTQFACNTQSGTHLMGYQNNVESKVRNVMMLAIPTKLPSTVKFHDTRPYADFLTVVGEKIMRKELENTRGGLAKSPENYQRVGQYEFRIVKNEDMINELLILRQPIQNWAYQFEKIYEGWSWLFCITDANTKMSSQPILIEYETFLPEIYFYPAMDVHGNEGLLPHVKRDHIFVLGVEGLVKDTVVMNSNEINGFPVSNLSLFGFSCNELMPNGDIYTSITPNAEKDFKFNMMNYE